MTAGPCTDQKTVVLVHGILDSELSMFYMRRRLEKAGYHCIAPTLKPNDARLGLADLSSKLKTVIDEKVGPSARFSIVAFSMGGLVARHYLLENGGAERCNTFVSISSPHQGTWLAFCYPGKGSREMRPNSPFLTALQEREHALSGVKCFSYRTPLDLIIVPARSSEWSIATNRQMFCLAHPFMIINGKVADRVIEDLE